MTYSGYDKSLVKKAGIDVIYLAGGCFWGIQKLMQSIPGVVDTTSGYANGTACENPSYSLVCTGTTEFKEAVRVEFDPKQISLDALLFVYFSLIDPTVKNAQGNDIGTQYQTGVYYTDEPSKQTVERIAEIERERFKKFFVEIKPLQCFYDAEEYHQHYLDKNPSGYCHISKDQMRYARDIVIDPAAYTRPAKEIIAEKLTDLQYRVTQQAATEPSFENEFWNHYERGIYVDIVTGEPLFTSKNKYKSSCGWPSFSAGIDANAFVNLEDRSHFMKRAEVRSRAGNSHLGHIFYGDRESPSGMRYCINSAALRFIPYEKMDAEGYGHLKKYVD